MTERTNEQRLRDFVDVNLDHAAKYELMGDSRQHDCLMKALEWDALLTDLLTQQKESTR